MLQKIRTFLLGEAVLGHVVNLYRWFMLVNLNVVLRASRSHPELADGTSAPQRYDIFKV
jgi:hypothetical protein